LTSTPGAPSPWWARADRASPRRRGSSQVFCRRAEGEVLFNGKPLPASFKARSRDELRQCQMIYQMADTALNPKLRLRELIGRPAEMYLGLKGKALDARIKRPSGADRTGARQIHRSLAVRAFRWAESSASASRGLLPPSRSFIICDEVTSALDQIVQEGILKLLDRLQSEFNLAYMFITHDLATVKSIADEVVVMQHGAVVEHGAKAEIFADPQEDYTRLLLSSVPEMDPDWLNRLLAARSELDTEV
jgi:peptide/nickel transport system ATP-binding protein